MAQSLDLFLNLGSITGLGQSSLNADDRNPAGYRPGAIAIMCDAFGLRIFRYTQTQMSGGAGKGELQSKVGAVTGTVTAAAGELNDTTHLSDTSNFTADYEIGKICHITDNNDSAGAAPEGEVAVITDNTASIQTFDAGYALSVAPAVSDTYSNFSVYTGEDSADGDNAIEVLGIVMADRTNLYYGWNQMYGMNPGALYDTAVSTAGAPVVCGVACVSGRTSDTEEDWIGFSPGGIAADLASPFRSLVFIDVLHMSQALA